MNPNPGVDEVDWAVGQLAKWVGEMTVGGSRFGTFRLTVEVANGAVQKVGVAPEETFVPRPAKARVQS